MSASTAPPEEEGAESAVAARLQAFLEAQLPPGAQPQIHGLRRMTGGLSRENWHFDARWQEGGEPRRHQLIMRRDPQGSVLETDRRVEFAVLRALADSPVPTPRVFWMDADGSRLGRPSLIMERCDGVNDHFVLEGGHLQLGPDARLALAKRYCETLAALHRFAWRGSELEALLPSPGDQGARAAVAEWAAYLERQLQEPYPELVAVLGWLRDHCPRAQATVLVHGDFKPGNSLLKAGELQVMLDWETAHLGDPLEDLGWVTNPLRQREHLIPGLWERADLVRYYRELTGFQAPEAELHFWNVFSNFKLNAILLTGVRSFREGRSERPWSDNRMLARLQFQLLGWTGARA